MASQGKLPLRGSVRRISARNLEKDKEFERLLATASRHFKRACLARPKPVRKIAARKRAKVA